MKPINIIIIVLLQCNFSFIHAQSFQGRVLDKLNKQPIVFAEVYFPELQTSTTTDYDGYFTIEHTTQEWQKTFK